MVGADLAFSDLLDKLVLGRQFFAVHVSWATCASWIGSTFPVVASPALRYYLSSVPECKPPSLKIPR